MQQKTLFTESWYNKGIKFVSGFIIGTYKELSEKYNININFPDVLNLIKCIPKYRKNDLSNISEDDYHFDWTIENQSLTYKDLFI